MAAKKHPMRIGDITGGTQPLKRDIGTVMTIQHIWDTYRWFPGFKAILQLQTKAIWSNGLSDDSIEPDRLLELKDGHEWTYAYGYAAIIVDATTNPPRCEAWHPMIDGVGFQFSEFSRYGYPHEIELHLKFPEAETPEWLKIPAYPCETDRNGEFIRQKPIPGKFGFFIIRTRGGVKGVMGLPAYMDLIDPIRSQYDILKAYIPYAEKQGMAFPAIFLKNNDPTNRANIQNQFDTQPTSNRLLILSMDDAIEWISPQANAYDPFPILNWINTMISRASQMNRLMLEGDPAGYLSASETAISNWEASVKEEQIFWRTQFLPIFEALGAPDDINFKDPSKPTFVSLMEGIKALREGMDGIVEKEDIVRLMEEHLERHGQREKLHATKDEVMVDGTPANPQGSQTNQAEAN